MEIQKEYGFAMEKVMTVPADEPQLFELKSYIKNTKILKDQLAEREQNVIHHTYILEDFLFALDPNVDLQL